MPPAAPSSLERQVEAIAASLEGDDGLRVRVALVEQGLRDHRAQSATQHTAVLTAIADLRRDLSDQGKTPPPIPLKPSGGWRVALAPGTGRELGLLVLAILAGVGGPVTGILLRAADADHDRPAVAAQPTEEP